MKSGLVSADHRVLAATTKLEKRWDETPSEQARRHRFGELGPLDPRLTYGMSDPKLISSKESHLGHHSNGVVMPPLRGSTPQNPNLAKLEYLWTTMDKLESRMEAYDRRLERLERLRPHAPNPLVGIRRRTVQPEDTRLMINQDALTAGTDHYMDNRPTPTWIPPTRR